MSGTSPCPLWGFLLQDDTVESAEYRAIFESSPDGFLVVDRSGIIRAANPRVQQLFGWDPAELQGQSVEVLVPEMHREAHAGHRSRFVADPHNRPMGVGLDLRGRRRDGSSFPVEISLSPWTADEGDLRVICTVRDVSEYKRLRNFSEGALQATEDERQRIARELHDDTAQRLATLILRVRRLAEERDAHKRALLHEEIREEIIDAAEAVKRMARGLRPPEIEELGLALAVTAHVRSLREGAGFEVETELGAVDHLLNVTAKLALYRIVQEALSNARRHSGTTDAKVRLLVEDGAVVTEISDVGRGFLQSQALEAGGGLGLVGMKERAAMVGGRLTVHSEPGGGTTVRVTIPVLGWEKGDG